MHVSEILCATAEIPMVEDVLRVFDVLFKQEGVVYNAGRGASLTKCVYNEVGIWLGFGVLLDVVIGVVHIGFMRM